MERTNQAHMFVQVFSIIKFNCGPLGTEATPNQQLNNHFSQPFLISFVLSSTIFPSNYFRPAPSCFLYLSLNFTFHRGISQPVTDSCSPPPPDPQLPSPSIHHSAVPRQAGRSRTDCTKGLGGVTGPRCLLGSVFL